MEGTRLRILQQLQGKINDTVGGLAVSMGLAPATIRRHLDILQRDRLVAFEEVRKKTGRPEHSFFLTEDGHQVLPKSYDLLLRLVVDELARMSARDLAGMDGRSLLEALFTRLSAPVADPAQHGSASASLDERIALVLDILGAEDFLPEAEVVDHRVQIKLMNCPFRTVAIANSAVCDYDSKIISGVLGHDMSLTSCVHDGDPCCVYESVLSEQTAVDPRA
jgi:predicted ArsR family transcriptional regulator